MATLTLEYNARNSVAKRIVDMILSMDDLFKTVTVNHSVKKSRLEQSLEEVDKGNVVFLTGPAKP